MRVLNQAIYLSSVFTMSFLSIQPATAACNAFVNGRPMTQQECANNTRIYGAVLPGSYRVDNQGNWYNVNNPSHRGNVYQDAQPTSGGRFGGNSLVSPSGVYDSSGGCEGGSCVNIIW